VLLHLTLQEALAMTPTNKRSRRQVLAEMVLLTSVMLLSVYLGTLLFSVFEPTLVRGAMRGLRIFLGVVVFVLGFVAGVLAAQGFTRKSHFELRFATLVLIIGPLEYLGGALALDAFVVG
jgi:uncharacterized membrane protein